MKSANIILYLVGLSSFCGCCSIYVEHDFAVQSAPCLVDGLTSDVRISPRLTTFGTPVLLEYQQRSAPYDLRIRIYDASQSFRLMEVTEIKVAFSDGDMIRKDMLWQRNIHHSDSTERTVTDIAFDEAIDEVIERHADATITLKGRLIKSDGEVVEFTTLTTFKAKSRLLIVPLFLHGA